jgi:hypothetical protein
MSLLTNAEGAKAAGCDGKTRYLSPSKAEKRARTMRRRYDKAFMPYRCGFCRRWHIGSRERWQDGAKW